ncbi:MAG: acyl-CoA dehydrogenase family protein, partial [Mycobacteriaceae bacterium]
MTDTVQVSEKQARAVAEEARESGWDKPSFAKELFMGRFRLDLVHPYPQPTPDDRASEQRFLDHLREYCVGLDGAVIERESQIPDEYVKGFAELGCFGIKIPTEYGGLGLSQVAYNHALMMASSVHPSIGALLSAHQSIGVPEPLKLAGTEEQKQAFLPRCAAGAVSAFLLTEPDVG